ncbi:MAG: CdaR family protein [Bacteroidota bacterium]|nr:CdaR family protein [Bacteroidota bacterium]
MAEKKDINFFSVNMQKLKSFFLSKDILSFLLFLALSSAFWFVHALGKERETNIVVPVRYVGVPLNVAITNSPPAEISLNIKDQGLRLFDYSNNHLTPLTIDLSRVFYQKGEILITPDLLSGRISRYLKPTTTVLDIHPDSILIQYEKLSVKTLPIKLFSKIELAHQYKLSNNILLDPNMVTVFGPKRMLDTLKYVRTEYLDLKNLNDTSSYFCKLKPIRSARFSSKQTRVTVFVEPFTERKVQIPVTAINCPWHLAVRTFPAFVNVTYIVGLSQFNTLAPTDIQVYLDYNDLKLSKQSKQKLKIKNNTSHISNIRISPSEVEFILEEK